MFENTSDFKQSILVKLEKIADSLKTDLGYISSNINYLYSLFSRFYSLYRSVQLIDKLENYDLIIISRFDLHLLKKLNIYKYNFDANTIYINNFNGHNLLNGSTSAMLDGVVNKYNQDILNYGFHDYFFLGNKNTIMKFSRIYLFLEKYFSPNSGLYSSPWPRISGHSICAYHISMQNTEYTYTEFQEHIDFCLERDMDEQSEEKIITKGYKLESENKFEEAVTLLLNYQKITPSANIYIVLGYLHVRRKMELDKGLYYYKKSLEIIPSAGVYESIIKIYMFQNNIIEAKKYCNESMNYFNSTYVSNIYEQVN